MARVFGVRVYEMKESVWYYRPIMAIHRKAYAVDRAHSYFVARFIRRSHIISLPIAGLWRDADERMFLACFLVLGRFVEKELGTVAWVFDGEASDLYRGYRLHSCGGNDEKAIDLWLWYKNELPALEKAYAADLTECYSGEWVTEDAGDGLRKIVDLGRVREPKFEHDYPETVKDQKLAELIELRRMLWT
jgi:hypothetical protein